MTELEATVRSAVAFLSGVQVGTLSVDDQRGYRDVVQALMRVLRREDTAAPFDPNKAIMPTTTTTAQLGSCAVFEWAK